MPRDHATVNYALTNDPDYRALPAPAQHLYLTLWVAPGISWCGVRDWRPARISGLTAGMTADDVRLAGDCLRARHFLVTDDETEEALLRSWVRFDGLMKQWRLAVSFVTAYNEVSSQMLREAIVYEAQKLRRIEPDLRCWEDPRVLEVLDHPAVSAKVSTSVSDPFGGGFGVDLDQTAPSVWGSVSTPRTPTPTPTPLTPAPSRSSDVVDGEDAPTASAPTKKSGRKKPAVPLPADWKPNDDHLKRCQELGLDPATELARFRLHAEANDRRQVVWNAAFTSWLMSGYGHSAAKTTPIPSPGWHTNTVPACPPEVADKPGAYDEWLRDWREGRPVMDADGHTVQRQAS